MTALFISFFALVGACIGSFINAFVFRVYEGWTMQGRSKCPHCKTTLKPHHLVPVISWLALRGKCVTCHKAIHPIYPIVEFLSGCVWALVAWEAWQRGMGPGLMIGSLLFFSCLIFLSAFDGRYQLLPVEFILGCLVVFAPCSIFLFHLISWQESLLGIALGGGFFGVQVLLSRGRWMGSGDPYLGAMIGGVLGWKLLAWGIYLTYTVSALVVGALWALGIIKRGTRVSFAPLLSLGILLAWAFYSRLEHLLTSLLG